ncbi:MAG: RNA polymerase sigma factor [Candidatus Binataceae bacterium]
MFSFRAVSTRVRSLIVRTDEELIRESLKGETAAFGELASIHRGNVERICCRFFSDPEIVLDLTQESFIRAFAGLRSYREELPFRSWLRAIVVNVCYDELRRRRRRPEDLVADLGEAEQSWAQLVNETTPEDMLEQAQKLAAAYDLAHKLLDTLRPEDRVITTLKESEELTIEEIAKIMGWSGAKVKIRIFRARQLMRRRAEQILSMGRGARKR